MGKNSPFAVIGLIPGTGRGTGHARAFPGNLSGSSRPRLVFLKPEGHSARFRHPASHSSSGAFSKAFGSLWRTTKSLLRSRMSVVSNPEAVMQPILRFLLAIGLIVSASGAERPDANWEKVNQLRRGQTVRVLCSRQAWTGRLTKITEEGLTLDVGGTEKKAARSEVIRVQSQSRAKSALIGLAIGAPAGVGFGYAIGHRSNLKSGEMGPAVGFGAALFAAAGAGIGALVPAWKTVYEASPPPDGSSAREAIRKSLSLR